MVTPALLPAGLAVLAVLGLYYRRFRRLFGRQRVQPARMKARVGLLLVAAALLLLRQEALRAGLRQRPAVAAFHPRSAGAAAARGTGCGRRQ